MAEIQQSLREHATTSPLEEVAVIVTVEPQVTSEQLAALGLAITQRFERIGTVCGTLKGADLDRLADQPGVLRIESDSPMQAL
jgi:hypothetical protein